MADAEKQAAPAKADEPASSGGGGSKLVVILTIVNLLVSVGVGAVLFISHKKDKAASSVADIDPNAEPAGHGEEPAAAEHGGGHGDAHGGGGDGGKEEPKKNKGDVRMVNLDQFTVNLSTPGGSQQKFVRVNISIEVASEDSETEIQGKMPQVRNSIIDLFNGKRPTDLQSAEQRDFLKEEIKNALNSFMSSGKVKGVYFTNFAVTG